MKHFTTASAARVATRAKKCALLVGLKQVSAQHYQGWDGTNGCQGCELDVDCVSQILHPFDYETCVRKTNAATKDGILTRLRRYAHELKAGDLFVFYFSGHGGQQEDKDNDEEDGKDETLVAYDAEIIDDELDEIWLSFRPGVRIVMLSDSCNSGTNFRGRPVRFSTPIKARAHARPADPFLGLPRRVYLDRV
jgi:metacaspase-1